MITEMAVDFMSTKCLEEEVEKIFASRIMRRRKWKKKFF